MRSMEDPAILRLNLTRFQRLLQTETDPTKRHMALILIAETEARLREFAGLPEASVSLGADSKDHK